MTMLVLWMSCTEVLLLCALSPAVCITMPCCTLPKGSSIVSLVNEALAPRLYWVRLGAQGPESVDQPINTRHAPRVR